MLAGGVARLGRWRTTGSSDGLRCCGLLLLPWTKVGVDLEVCGVGVIVSGLSGVGHSWGGTELQGGEEDLHSLRIGHGGGALRSSSMRRLLGARAEEEGKRRR
ncbi:hypothetical protein ZWY2020_048017 [Hordeum vulgare]|nr:hypothetical protein ZWY2020_048017 [Hordeum vulgare]